jgi:hypothetical protein
MGQSTMSPSTLLGANFALRRSVEAPSGVINGPLIGERFLLKRQEITWSQASQ